MARLWNSTSGVNFTLCLYVVFCTCIQIHSHALDDSSALNCTLDQFLCPGIQRCISKLWICDFDPDCPGGEDETYCSTSPGEVSLPLSAYKCIRDYTEFLSKWNPYVEECLNLEESARTQNNSDVRLTTNNASKFQAASEPIKIHCQEVGKTLQKAEVQEAQKLLEENIKKYISKNNTLCTTIQMFISSAFN